jgi:hypothetical protein
MHQANSCMVHWRYRQVCKNIINRLYEGEKLANDDKLEWQEVIMIIFVISGKLRPGSDFYICFVKYQKISEICLYYISAFLFSCSPSPNPFSLVSLKFNMINKETSKHLTSPDLNRTPSRGLFHFYVWYINCTKFHYGCSRFYEPKETTEEIRYHKTGQVPWTLP